MLCLERQSNNRTGLSVLTLLDDRLNRVAGEVRCASKTRILLLSERSAFCYRKLVQEVTHGLHPRFEQPNGI